MSKKLNLLFHVLLLLTVLWFISYSLYKKHRYLENVRHKLNERVASDPLCYKGGVSVFENPGGIGKLVLIGDIGLTVCTQAIKALHHLEKNHREIDLYICSDGGKIGYGFAIADAVKHARVKVNTYAIGHCFSSGTFILAAGTGKRHLTKNALLDLHFVSQDEKAAYGYFGYVIKRYLSNFWKENGKIPSSVNMMKEQTIYLNPSQAIKWGIVDVVY